MIMTNKLKAQKWDAEEEKRLKRRCEREIEEAKTELEINLWLLKNNIEVRFVHVRLSDDQESYATHVVEGDRCHRRMTDKEVEVLQRKVARAPLKCFIDGVDNVTD